MKRAMARQAEAERVKIINAEIESLAAAALGAASDIVMEYPLALQLRTLQSWWRSGGQEHHRCVPRPADEHDRETGAKLARETAAAQPAPAPIAFSMQAPAVHTPSGNGTPPVPSAN